MTYKELVNNIKQIVQDHYMLADFGYGQISDIKTGGDDGEADYPYAFLNPGSHTRGERSITYRFNLIVMDMYLGDHFLTAQSQCQQYIDDILAELKYNNNEIYDININATLTPFKERFQDVVGGMTATLDIEVPQKLNLCIAPIEPEPESCIPTLTVFSTNENRIDYVRGPGLPFGLRYEERLTSNPAIGSWDDQYLQAAVAGSYEFEINSTIEFTQPTGNEQLPGVPHLKYFANPPGVNVEIAPTCDSGNWPTVWSADPITYNAIYNLTLEQAQNFISINSLDNGGEYSDFTQKAEGTLTIGYAS